MAFVKKKIRIGDLLQSHGLITEEQLLSALAEQKNTGRRLGVTVVQLGYVTEQQLLELLAQQLNIRLVNIIDYDVDETVIEKISELQARRFRALVIDRQDDSYVVAMADPTDIHRVDEIQQLLGSDVEIVIAPESDLLRMIDLLYRRTGEISSLAEELDTELADEDFSLEDILADNDVSDAPVVKLINTIFEDAVQVGASDIHIEPDENSLRIRLRVDGFLQEQVMNESRVSAAIVLRLKLMSGLDISEKRRPQDGRFNIKVKDHNIDVRLSTMPLQHGESVVMRLLDQTGGLMSLEKLGMESTTLINFRHMIRRPHGMVLVTGPTGSGKSTTLYGALNELNAPQKKIITIEDPVEYRLPRINQVQVNPKIHLNFATVLRSVLRQDPDIVMIGEMRDQETVEIGLRAAMTGHLVLSTLHTNDAISSALRLADMGAEPYLTASALLGVIAQRLVRRICHHCAEPYEPTGQEKIWLDAMKIEIPADAEFKHGKGCSQCNHSGYRGRVGVYEMLTIDGALADCLRQNDPMAFTKAARNSRGFVSLVESAFSYALRNIITLEEVFRLAEAIVEHEEAVVDVVPGSATEEQGGS